jgi:hypothetical protein
MMITDIQAFDLVFECQNQINDFYFRFIFDPRDEISFKDRFDVDLIQLLIDFLATSLIPELKVWAAEELLVETKPVSLDSGSEAWSRDFNNFEKVIRIERLNDRS